SSSDAPASTEIVRSAGLYSAMPCMRAALTTCSTRAGARPHDSHVPAPAHSTALRAAAHSRRMRAASAASAGWCTAAGVTSCTSNRAAAPARVTARSAIDPPGRRADPLPARVHGQDLHRIRETARIPYAAHAAHRIQLALAEDELHVRALVEPDAVFACDGAAGLDARAHHLLGCRLDRAHLRFIAPVEDDRRVQVAVASVEHVAEADAVALGDVVDLAQYVRQAAAGHYRILHEHVGREAAHRAERLLACVPEALPLRFIRGSADLARAIAQTQ